MKQQQALVCAFLAVLLGAFLPVSSQGAYDPEAKVKKGKRWAISTGLRTGYDDNTTTAPSNAKGSWFNGIDLNGSYSYPTDTTFLSMRTGAGGTFFVDRPGSKFDFNNAFDFTLAHTFSPRLNLDISDSLRFGQEPQLSEGNTILRREGDYVNNLVNMGLSYQLTTKWFLDVAFLHDLWSYQDSALAAVLDRQAIGGGPALRYRLTEKTTLSLNYRFTRTAYDRSPRNANSHTMTAGISQSLTRKWNVNLDAGGEVRDEDNVLSKSSFVTPYANLGTSYLVTEKATLSGGARYSFQETDLSTFFVSRTIMMFGNFTWNFARNLSSSTGLNIVNNELTNAVTAGTPNADEWTYLVTETISWNFRENMTLSLGYTHTQIDSNVALRGYQRNVVTLSAGYQF